MAKIRRCPTCKVHFPTIDAVNDHYELTSHTPLPYKCESCERVYGQLSTLHYHTRKKHPHLPLSYNCGSCKRPFKSLPTLLSHLQLEHPHLPLPYNCKSCQQVFETSSSLQRHNESYRHYLQETIISKTTASAVIAQIDTSDWDPRRDDDDRDTGSNGWGSPDNVSNCDAQRDATLAEKASAVTAKLPVSSNILKPLSSASESILSSPSSRAGPSSSKLDEAKKRPSTVLNNNILRPISSISEPILPAPSESAGSSSSKLDEATASARAALHSRFAELGVPNSGEITPLLKSNIWGPKKTNRSSSKAEGFFNAAPSSRVGPSPSKLDEFTALAGAALRSRYAELDSGETTPLLKSNIWGPRKLDLSAPNLDESCSIATNLTPDGSNSKESKLPLNSLDIAIHPLACPGCQIDFKSFSGFVSHIENDMCGSSMCHEIEVQINACATQLFNNFQDMNPETSRLHDIRGL